MMHDYGLTIAGLLALGIGAQWLGWFTKKPAIIYLLVIGIVLGPVTHLFNPDRMLGALLFPFISLGVAIILFEGALTLKCSDIASHGRVVTRLVTVGVLVTVAVSGLAAWLFMGMSVELSLLFGALVCVTGPTVIAPLLRSVRPNKTISNILRWEGVLIDPVGALLVVLVFEYIIAGHSPLIFAQIIALGLTLGSLCALALALALKRHWLPEYLHNVATLAWVLLAFALSNAWLEESGLLTVTVMGMVLANIKGLDTAEILDFKESLSLLVISMLFILLAARIDFAGFARMGVWGIAVLLVVMFVARPLSVWLSAQGSSLTRNERLLLSWIAPRGIVAAAVSSLFVLRLGDIPGRDVLLPLVFTIIIGTVVVQSLTAAPLARALGVAEPVPNGVLISSITPFSLILGRALKENGFDVVMASVSYDQTARARMEGLPIFYGNIVSEHADRHLNLVGIGQLLALHPNAEQNMLIFLRYRSEFGIQHLYHIRTREAMVSAGYDQWDQAWLFDPKATASELNARVSAGAKLRTTTLSDHYTFAEYQRDNPDNIPLFAVSPARKLHIFSSKNAVTPARGWKVVALGPGKAYEAGEEDT